MVKQIVRVFVSVVLIFAGQNFVVADEGMWLFNNLPLKQLKDKYNFVPTLEWIEHVQKSSVRLPNCSASFVSADGLLPTNWHCAEDTVKALSTSANNYYENGFYARNLSEELKTNLNARVLMSVEAKGVQKPGLVCEEVVLYLGGQYQNYCYKVYNDIRLVFMPEQRVGFFGGDTDNFEYPRYTLDVSLFRVYENNKPARIKHYLKWSKSGAKKDELIFSSGHPGRTARLFTSAALKTERDVHVPFLLDLFRRRELMTTQFMIRSKENKQVAESDLFSWQNSRKLYVGKIRGLQDPKLMDQKESFEKKFLDDLYSGSYSTTNVLADNYASGLIMVGDAQDVIRQNYAKYVLLVRGLGFDSRLYDYAQSIVSGNHEFAKSVLEGRQKEAPLNLEYEEAKLRDSLSHLFEVFGPDDPLVVSLNNGPYALGQFLVYRTALSDVNEHLKLVEGGAQAVDQSDDPMIRFARFVHSQSQDYVLKMKEAIENEKQGYAKISDSLFRVYGTNRYSDATFTLRLSFGTVKGYVEDGGKVIPPWTTIGGAYKHEEEFEHQGAWKLFRERLKVNLSKPLNFISTLDITGGNSGSPVINKKGEIVGLVFDGNIDSLVSDYDYNYSSQSRAVAVHSAGILEILSKIYRADRLVQELTR